STYGETCFRVFNKTRKVSAMSRQKRTINKKWKLFFYILLTINIIVFLTVTLLIFWPVSETEEPTVVDHSEEEGSEFVVRTTKENLNELVNAYMINFFMIQSINIASH